MPTPLARIEIQTNLDRNLRPSTTVRIIGAVAVTAVMAGCAKSNSEPPPVVEHELPSTQILRVARRWRAAITEKGFRSEPSPISLFEFNTTSTLDLGQGGPAAREELEVIETFELRDGRRFGCSSKATANDQAHYGSRLGEPALELTRPALKLTRSCRPAGYPDPVLIIEQTSARFVLSDDALRGFAPTREKRVYLPID